MYGGNKKRYGTDGNSDGGRVVTPRIASWEDRLNQLVTNNDAFSDNDNERKDCDTCGDKLTKDNSKSSKFLSFHGDVERKHEEERKDDCNNIFEDDFVFHSQSSQPTDF